jgi:thioredoxin 1
MANPNVSEFTDDNFDSEVLQSDKPVLVDFWAEWCMPCRLLSPVIDAIANDFAGRAKVGKVDIETNLKIAARYSVQMIPTIMIFKDGQMVKKLVGGKKKDELAAALQELGA